MHLPFNLSVYTGENGQIVRTVLGGDRRMSLQVHGPNEMGAQTFPWLHDTKFQHYPTPFQTEVIRYIRRYDDIDQVSGNDNIFGGPGNDVLFGQRGNDGMCHVKMYINGAPLLMYVRFFLTTHVHVFVILASDISGGEGEDGKAHSIH